MGLFEVVAHDLVQLDQVASALFEPEGEACVQFRPDRLGERVIGGVSDQQVAETKRVLAWELRPVRSDQLLPYKSAKAGRHVGRFRSKRLDCAAVEHLTLDRAALEHASLRFVELVKTGRQQRLDRRRHRNLAVARFLRQRQHLLHEERVSAGRGADPATGRVVSLTKDGQKAVGLGGRERLEQRGRGVELPARPAWPAVKQLGPRHTQKQHRRVTAHVRDVLDEIQERLLGPLKIVPDDHQRTLFSRTL